MAIHKTKRFIAGAVCAKCYQIDKTVVYDDALWVYSECVACGYKQQRPKDDTVENEIDKT